MMISYHGLQSTMTLELNQLQNWLLSQNKLQKFFIITKYHLSCNLNEDARFELLNMFKMHVCYSYITNINRDSFHSDLNGDLVLTGHLSYH